MSDVRARFASPFEGGAIATRRPYVRRFTTTTSFIATWDYADVWMQASGGGGSNSKFATIGGAGGTSGQTCIGVRIKFVRGARYTYTQGAVGLGAVRVDGTSSPGSSAGNSTLKGPGVDIRLLGGFGGQANGTGGGIGGDIGIAGVSPWGWTIYAVALGGSANTSAAGSNGAVASAPVMVGGFGGVIGVSGAGGGSTNAGRGGTGGNAGTAGGNAETDSGAGGGGAGASTDSFTTYVGGDGGRGFLRLVVYP